jgi:ATP adenylyltransferase
MKDQIAFKDLLQKASRNNAEYWYGEIWQTVEKCVFCDLKERYTIKKYKNVILTTNLYPYINGHLLIIPKRHITRIKQLTSQEWEAVRTLQYVAQKMLKVVLGIKNSWFICREGRLGDESQKTVDHLHFHVLPYEKGLVEWNYSSIDYSAFEVASAFKDGNELMEKLISRFNKKYTKQKSPNNGKNNRSENKTENKSKN